MSAPGEEEDIGDPDVVLAQVQILDDEWEGGGDDSVLESTEDANDTERGDDGPELESPFGGDNDVFGVGQCIRR